MTTTNGETWTHPTTGAKLHRSHAGRLWRREVNGRLWFLSRRSTWHWVDNPLDTRWSHLTVPAALRAHNDHQQETTP